MKDKSNTGASATEVGSAEQEEKPSIWRDPAVPVGNGPSLPRWPVGAFAVAWAGWVVFLMVLLAMSGTPSPP